MDLKRINEKLAELFAKHRVIFWNDANADFKDELSECLPQDVEIVRPDVIGQFKAKVILEIEKPGSKFLLYSASSEPRSEDDWLLDIRLYGYQFRADTASMITEELGLQHLHLREHIAKRIKFFSSKQRFAKLQSIIASSDMEKEIDRKLLAVLVKAEHDRFFDIINAIYDSFPFDEGLDAVPEEFAAIEKMDMADIFWAFVREAFGYESENPSLRHLLTCLFISDLYLSLGDRLCQNVRQFILPSGFARNAAVCMSEWRDSIKMTESYDRLSEMVADALGIERYLREITLSTPDEINAFKDAVTFSATEKISAGAIKAYIMSYEATIDKDFVISFCRHRQALHWSNKRLGGETIPRESFWAVYEALVAAAEFMSKKLAFPQGFVYASARDVFEGYVAELYVFDRFYRFFYENAYIVDARGWDILKDIKSRMEDLYNNWFLGPIMMLWEEKLKVDSWRIDGVINQYDFFGKYPEARARDKSVAVFVIISDALRYEAGAEISEILNGKYRFMAKKEAMLGVVPSYTALGMAALLPHSKITYSAKAEVLVDEKGCSSTTLRSEILSAQKGLAIKGDDLVRMPREDARELVRGKNVVYLYHNTIDAIGDDSKTEDKTFTAVRDAVDEVCNIVSFLVNTLNARYVFITADHGFVYTDARPGETERNKGTLSDSDFIIFKKRYALGKNIPALDYVHQGTVSSTAGVTPLEDMQFAIPKGMSLFYFTGGSRYFHGGLSLQEVVVPVITVEQIRGKEKEKTRDKFVGVQVLGQDYRITTGKHRFEILQIEAVSDRVRPATFKIGVYADNEPVSDIQTVSFESASQEMADRKKEVVLTLKNINFEGGKTYRLILRNADTDIEEQSIPVRIDRVFTSDF
jgi:uncharacterized protein (TIGR02687 family)